MKVKPQQTIKTLIYTVGGEDQDKQTLAAILRGDMEINDEKLTQAVGGKHNELADEDTIKKVTSAETGFAGPVGLADKVDKVLVDHSVAAISTAVAGANKTDYHLKNVVPGRDFPLEGENIQICDIRNAVQGDTYQDKKLLFRRGIEVGQVFALGTKYSQKLNACFLDENGKSNPAIMGCYGIGINRIMASAIETGYDKDGIIWPVTIAPFEVLITPVGEDENIMQIAEKLLKELEQANIETLLDDRQVRGGVKFKDADLLGIPIRLTIGKKSAAQGNLELKIRGEDSQQLIALENAAEHIAQCVKNMKAKLNVEPA